MGRVGRTHGDRRPRLHAAQGDPAGGRPHDRSPRQLEAHIVGAEALPDRWHGSSITTRADLAPFTPEDLDEARSRDFERLAQLWRIRLAVITAQELDRAEDDDYSPREMAFCVVGSSYYADAVGELPGVSSGFRRP